MKMKSFSIENNAKIFKLFMYFIENVNWPLNVTIRLAI